ncbi:MAG: His/Gly/Thr/Pro-type tRNA ligase C-terminal domain-containing protein [Clostridium sp.]|nr:His/Gly/Thr/Pro-type tRNA ligase C-terminal domain-containing protein [Clostridium sp.]
MKLSQTGLGTIRVNNLDKSYPAQDTLLQTNQLVQYGTGIYAYNNVPLRLRQNVESVIRGVLDKYGCIEILLPTLQPTKLWEESGRLAKYIEEDVIMPVETDNGKFVMAPTAEEAVTEFVRGRITSYKNLPVILYQIGEKYRNEIRTRGYLLRGKTFPMMDAYSFDLNAEESAKAYQNIRKAYLEIFEILGLKVQPVAADSGAMGGNLSEEFMLESPIGEDTILVDKETGIAFNTEILEREDADEYLREKYGIKDKNNVEAKKSIELGHIFQLGTKYTESMNAKYIDQEGNEQLLYMGCYGIGVSRTVATIYEENVVTGKNGEAKGISLPVSVAPYLLQIIPKEEKREVAQNLYNELMEANVPVILDDRTQGMLGAKIKDCLMLGTPYMLVIGDKQEEGKFEVENSKTGEKKIYTEEELIKEFVNINNSRKYVK